jgi:phage tail tape-measure protein
MTTENEAKSRAANKKKHKREHREREAGGGVAGALAGAALGAIAGPPGVAVGAVLGAVAGSIAEVTIERNSAAKQTENDKLDAQIGVSGGELGAPNLEHPAATLGAYSGSSAGTNQAESEDPADGPIQPPPD